MSSINRAQAASIVPEIMAFSAALAPLLALLAGTAEEEGAVSLSLRSCNMLCVFQACRILRRCSALTAIMLSGEDDDDDGDDDDTEGEEGNMCRKHRNAVMVGLHRYSCCYVGTNKNISLKVCQKGWSYECIKAKRM